MKALGFLLPAVFLAPGALSAATFITDFGGDVCSIPPADQSPDGGDCRLIEWQSNPVGVFTMSLTGMDPNVVGDATVGISSTRADLFRTDGQLEPGGSRNNPVEFFELWLDDVYYGRLFDETTADEAAISPELAESVQINIDQATNTVDPFRLSFTVPEAITRDLVADGTLTARFDFRNSGDVNLLLDPTFVVSYDTEVPAVPVPLPAGGLLLAAGCLAFGAVGRRKRTG